MLFCLKGLKPGFFLKPWPVSLTTSVLLFCSSLVSAEHPVARSNHCRLISQSNSVLQPPFCLICEQPHIHRHLLSAPHTFFSYHSRVVIVGLGWIQLIIKIWKWLFGLKTNTFSILVETNFNRVVSSVRSSLLWTLPFLSFTLVD